MTPDVEEALADALDVAEQTGLRTLLVGAWARDLCLPADRRLELRKTNDADLAITVDEWRDIDRFFAASSAGFDVHAAELFMRHRRTRIKVDLVPCGALERPPGTLRLRNTSRTVNTTGLQEAFRGPIEHIVRGRRLSVPHPSAFVLLKLLAFLDRRAPRDLRDLGYVVRQFPVDHAAVWRDARALAGFERETLTWEDMNAWQVGQDLRTRFSPPTLDVFRASLRRLTSEVPVIRGLLAEQVRGPDDQIATADRILGVLMEATDEGPE